MDAHGGLCYLNRLLALLALFDNYAGESSGLVLSYDVIRLWTHDYENNPCPLDQAALSVLDHNAVATHWRCHTW